MRRFILIVSSSLMVGCWPQQWTLPPDAPPRPIGELSLPVYPPSSSRQVRLEVRAFIRADGTVREASISPSSGNEEWDSLAVASIRRWRFTPAIQGGSAVPLWIRFPVMLHFVEPRDVVLAEIVCTTRELADSLHALLVQGADFGVLARRHSTAATRTRDGYMGRVDITSYPLIVQMTVTAIGEGEVTKPLRVGDGFVLFKRLSEEK